jgi:psiF repeat
MKSLIGGTVLLLAIGASAALAQTSTPAPADKPAAAAKMSTDEKKAISKACSDQATAKGLHGMPRKKFRSECKKAGGKAPQ